VVQARLSVGTAPRPVTTPFSRRSPDAGFPAEPPATPSSLAEVAVPADALLAAAPGEEVAAWALQHWAVDVRSSAAASAWLRDLAASTGAETDAALARVLGPVPDAEERTLLLRLDVPGAVLWSARHRRAVLVRLLLARGWAEHAAAGAGVGVMAARLDLSALPRRRTTAWRALATVHADACWLVERLVAGGVRRGDSPAQAALARYVLGAGNGAVVVEPERALAYWRAGVSAPEAEAMEGAGEAGRPTLAVLRGLAALRG